MIVLHSYSSGLNSESKALGVSLLGGEVGCPWVLAICMWLLWGDPGALSRNSCAAGEGYLPGMSPHNNRSKGSPSPKKTQHQATPSA